MILLCYFICELFKANIAKVSKIRENLKKKKISNKLVQSETKIFEKKSKTKFIENDKDIRQYLPTAFFFRVKQLNSSHRIMFFYRSNDSPNICEMFQKKKLVPRTEMLPDLK